MTVNRPNFPAGESGYIAVYDNLIPSEVCSQLVRECEKNLEKFQEGETLGGMMSHIKCSLDLPLEPEACGWDWWNASAARLSEQVLEAVIPAFNHYLEKYTDLYVPVLFGDTGYRVQRYAKGQGFYRRHTDSVPWDPIGRKRLLSMVMYLNTVETGGETWFPSQGVKVAAVEGRVAMFPAGWTFPHQGMLPLSGDKWIISTFIVPEMFDGEHDHPHPHDHAHDHSHDHPAPDTVESAPPTPSYIEMGVPIPPVPNDTTVFTA